MNLKRLGSITAKGEVAFRNLMTEMAVVSDPLERRERALAIISDPELCNPVPDAPFIDLDMRFASALEFAKHVYEAIAPLGTSGIRDRGINLFIFCAYIDQLAKGKARKLDNYFLDERSKGETIRNYRNAVFVFLSLYHYHRKDALICPVLLRKPANELGNVLERIAQSQKLFASQEALRLVVFMFFDVEKMQQRKPPRTKRGKTESTDVALAKALKELSSILFVQLTRTYEVSRMTAKQLFDSLHDTDGLGGWKRYAEAAFAHGDRQGNLLKAG